MKESDLSLVVPAPKKARPFSSGNRFLEPNHRFDTTHVQTDNMRRIEEQLMSPEDFLEKVQQGEDRRHDIKMRSAKDLNLGYQKREGNNRGGFYIEPDYKIFPAHSPMRDWFGENKRMWISQKGVESACKLINRSPDVFHKFSNPNDRFINEFRDRFRPRASGGFILRTTYLATGTEGDRFVDSLTDGSFNTVSGFELMKATMARVKESYGDSIRGVQRISDVVDGVDNSGYRLIFGDPIFKETSLNTEEDYTKTMWLMLSFRTTDSGLSDTVVNLALWRMICMNGNMRSDMSILRASWNRFDDQNSFLNRIKGLLNRAGLFGRYMRHRFEEMNESKLKHPPGRILWSMREQNLIDKDHAEQVEYKMGISKVDTCYDFLNVLTDAAKTHMKFRRRERAESNAMAIAMQPNSFNGIVSEGFDRRKRWITIKEMSAAVSSN